MCPEPLPSAVHDGADPRDPLLGKFCGSELLPSLRGHGVSLLLVFRTDASGTARGWKASFQRTLGPEQGCGGFLTGPSASFVSPDSDSDGRYDKNLDCVWVLAAPANSRIRLAFSAFALEAQVPGQGCRYDYVQVFDGESERAPLAGTFCGSTTPAPLLSSGNFLTVQFVSDSTLEREGFNATFTTVGMPCGGTYNATWVPQSLSSPSVSSPGALPSCTWVLEAPPQEQVKVSVLALRLPRLDCTHNHLELRDSPQSPARPGVRLCGGHAAATPPFYSSTRTAVVVFTAETFDGESSVGFTYQIAGERQRHLWREGGGLPASEGGGGLHTPMGASQEPGPLARKPRGDFTTAHLSQREPRVYAVCRARGAPGARGPPRRSPRRPAPPSGCDREYRQAFGELQSPGWPGSYGGDLDCSAVLTAPGNRTIALFFHSFALEPSAGCQSDFLEVRDGNDSSSPLRGKFCGSLLPNPVFSQHNSLYLRFKSNNAVSCQGYEIVWTSSSSGCGGVLSGARGSFTSPGYPGTYPNHTHCEWTLLAPAETAITVSFPFVSIDGPEDCAHNYLRLHDGPDARAPAAGPYCGAPGQRVRSFSEPSFSLRRGRPSFESPWDFPGPAGVDAAGNVGSASASGAPLPNAENPLKKCAGGGGLGVASSPCPGCVFRLVETLEGVRLRRPRADIAKGPADKSTTAY
ncbi:cubilin-like [Tamandua tetradactyla]|uniref:cubilin-like n=1 Tax=Tamandua tetradactyla TaxID=48850 RepID=UPI004053C8B2